MIKVKLLFTTYRGEDSYDGYFVVDDTDWEEIEEEDLEFLKRNVWKFGRNQPPYRDLEPKIVVQDKTPITQRLRDLKKIIEIEKKKELEEKKKREEAKKKREERKLLREAKSKQELFEKLKKELGKE